MTTQEQTELLRQIDALVHEYHSYSASAGGLQARKHCVDSIHTPVAAALGVEDSEYPLLDLCPQPCAIVGCSRSKVDRGDGVALFCGPCQEAINNGEITIAHDPQPAGS